MKKLLLAFCLMIATIAHANVQQPIICPQSMHAIENYHAVIICRQFNGRCLRPGSLNPQTIDEFIKEAGYARVVIRIDVAAESEIFTCLEVSK